MLFSAFMSTVKKGKGLTERLFVTVCTVGVDSKDYSVFVENTCLKEMEKLDIINQYKIY